MFFILQLRKLHKIANNLKHKFKFNLLNQIWLQLKNKQFYLLTENYIHKEKYTNDYQKPIAVGKNNIH